MSSDFPIVHSLTHSLTHSYTSTRIHGTRHTHIPSLPHSLTPSLTSSNDNEVVVLAGLLSTGRVAQGGGAQARGGQQWQAREAQGGAEHSDDESSTVMNRNVSK